MRVQALDRSHELVHRVVLELLHPWHVAVGEKPGQDAALVAGMLNVILSENLHDTAFCAEHTDNLDRLTEALADELRPRGIRVNAVLPTIIDTPANREDMPDADFSTWVTTGQLAKIIAFLLSDEASGVSGASIPTL